MKLYIVNEFVVSGDYNGNPLHTFEQNHVILANDEEEAKRKVLQKIRQEKLEWVGERDIEHMMEFGISISIVGIPSIIEDYQIKLEK